MKKIVEKKKYNAIQRNKFCQKNSSKKFVEKIALYCFQKKKFVEKIRRKKKYNAIQRNNKKFIEKIAMSCIVLFFDKKIRQKKIR